MADNLNPLFRAAQQEILQYKSGKLAVAAVPGSGKTFTLAHLAAVLVSRMSARDILKEREILVVTFSNSAVNTLRQRIATVLQQDRGLLPYVGYRVRTLHGLAHDIVRERPALVGLSEDFRILDEQVTRQIIREIAETSMRTQRKVFDHWLPSVIVQDEKQYNQLYNRSLPEYISQLCERFIKHCKDNALTPGDVYSREHLSRFPLLGFCTQIYDDYQRSLSYRGAVDFDDLVLYALIALKDNSDYLKRLQQRWSFVLEDEAQDSSSVQENMLRMLTDNKNWIRVGDPNQAINTTFTTANPQYLRNFAQEDDVNTVNLTQSGRFGRPIADLANLLVRWVVEAHPNPDLRQAFEQREIHATSPGDVQPNPPTAETFIHIEYSPANLISPEEEIRLVTRSLQQWLADNPHRTVAVLSPENSRGFKLAETLNQYQIPHEELLRSTSSTRHVTKILHTILAYLARPTEPAALSRLYGEAWYVWKHTHNPGEDDNLAEDTQVANIQKAILRCRNVEDFLLVKEAEWPTPLKFLSDKPALQEDVMLFTAKVRWWLQASYLPINQLIILIARDLFSTPADIALSYKIALALSSAQEINPQWGLWELSLELQSISDNERRFLGMDDASTGYSPKSGVVTISTMHAAKGLEWDRVYLMGVNEYSFPSGQASDQFLSERWFVRDGLNLEAEMLAQLQSLIDGDSAYVEGEATEQARIDYTSERLRLLYVGITRARRELIITWNTGRYSQNNADQQMQPALALRILKDYLDGVFSI